MKKENPLKGEISRIHQFAKRIALLALVTLTGASCIACGSNENTPIQDKPQIALKATPTPAPTPNLLEFKCSSDVWPGIKMDEYKSKWQYNIGIIKFIFDSQRQCYVATSIGTGFIVREEGSNEIKIITIGHVGDESNASVLNQYVVLEIPGSQTYNTPLKDRFIKSLFFVPEKMPGKEVPEYGKEGNIALSASDFPPYYTKAFKALFDNGSKPLEISKRKLQIGDNVVTYRRGKTQQFRVVNITGNYITADCLTLSENNCTIHGDSGSPVIYAGDSKVVGTISAASFRGDPKNSDISAGKTYFYSFQQ